MHKSRLLDQTLSECWPWANTSVNGSPLREHSFFADAPITQFEAASITYIHTDHLGTPRIGSDENSLVVWRWDSDPFGANLPDEAVDGDGVSQVVHLRFPGQYFDGESRMNYNYFRTYDPTIGRYTQSDAIGLLGGLNTYGYAGGNPIKFLDAYGLEYYPEYDPRNGDIVFLPYSGPYLLIGPQLIEACIADFPGNKVDEGCNGAPIPEGVDVDFIYVGGVWYKIKGLTAFVGKSSPTGKPTVSGLVNLCYRRSTNMDTVSLRWRP